MKEGGEDKISITKHSSFLFFKKTKMMHGRKLHLIAGVPTLCFNTSTAPPTHGIEQSLNPLLWDVIPLLLGCGDQLSAVPGTRTTTGNGSLQLVPEMLYWGHIGRVGGPVQHLDVIVFQEIPGQACRVRPRVVLLEELDLRMLIQERDNFTLQDLIHIALGIQITIEHHQGRS